MFLTSLMCFMSEGNLVRFAVCVPSWPRTGLDAP